MDALSATKLLKENYDLSNYKVYGYGNTVQIACDGVAIDISPANMFGVAFEEDEDSIQWNECQEDVFQAASVLQINAICSIQSVMDKFKILGHYCLDGTEAKEKKVVATGAFCLAVMAIVLMNDMAFDAANDIKVEYPIEQTFLNHK